MTLNWLALALKEGRRPSDLDLRQGLETALGARDRPDFELCAAAAALLGDGDLWRKVVADDEARDYRGYQALKRAGVDSGDLGRYPSLEVSADRVRSGLKNLLEKVDPGLAQEIREFAKSVSDTQAPATAPPPPAPAILHTAMPVTDSFHFELTWSDHYRERHFCTIQGQEGQITYQHASPELRGAWQRQRDTNYETVLFAVEDCAAVWQDICELLDTADAWNLWHGRDLREEGEHSWALRANRGDRRLECRGEAARFGCEVLLSYLKDLGRDNPAGGRLQEARSAWNGLRAGADPGELLLLLEWEPWIPRDLAGRLDPQCLPAFYARCLKTSARGVPGHNRCNRIGHLLLAMLDRWPQELEAPLPPAELFPEANLDDDLSQAMVCLLVRVSGGRDLLWSAFGQSRACHWLGRLVPTDDDLRERVLGRLAEQSDLTLDQCRCIRDWLLRDPLLNRLVLQSGRPELTEALDSKGLSNADDLRRLRDQARDTQSAASVEARLAGLETLVSTLEQAQLDQQHRLLLRQCLDEARRQVKDGGAEGTADVMGRQFYDFYRWLDRLSLNPG